MGPELTTEALTICQPKKCYFYQKEMRFLNYMIFHKNT